ncbi:Heterokaryon incompatibility [Macrophomina phaseolina MS6]|uniref:Heterokaryon incompatibility n=1 Tax=Macrophomina phaseolina (strain MS6) TaxID=1126212 RepID=K2RUF9_MACPH|nr:Heterokaryon incompatibility [Macrophomina phaseolina MS6]
MKHCCHCGQYGSPTRHCPAQRKQRRGNAKAPSCSPHASKRYRYAPLKSNDSIRLLVLLPGLPETPVRCELLVEPLCGSRRYEAISYAWGGTRRKGVVFCHGSKLNVPQNLVDALQTFRRRSKRRVLWADSICINQDDIPEREKQVRHMGMVFERAERVLVWLGYDKYLDCRKLFNVIERLAIKVRTGDDWAYHKMLEDPKGTFWSTLERFMRCDWFSRLWVVQEIGFASDAILYQNREFLRWRDLVAMNDHLRRHYHNLLSSNGRPNAQRVSDMSRSDFRGSRAANPGRYILRLLWLSRVQLCSDDRDRVYAFLAHACFRQTLANPDSGLFLKVSYEVPPAALFTSFAERLLGVIPGQPLFFLVFVSHNMDAIRGNVHSWVPQLNIDIWPSPLDSIRCPKFEASAQVNSKVYIDDGVLSLRGLAFDSIEWVSEIFHSQSIPQDASKAFDVHNPHPLSQIWNRICDKNGSVGRDMLEALALTLCDTRNVAGEHWNAEEIVHFLAYLDEMGIAVPPFEEDIGCGSITRFLIYGRHSHRRIFMTSRGWIGLGPAVASVGHEVSILFGVQTPYVVWQLPSASEDIYRLCVECYVHGIMDGEAIKMWEEGFLEEKIFNLV